jgi:hypothetical protein
MCEKDLQTQRDDETTVHLDGKFPCNARLSGLSPLTVFDKEPMFGDGGRHIGLKRI